MTSADSSPHPRPAVPESEEHADLVAMLRSYIADRFCEGQGHRVITDSTSSDSRTRPPSIAGYVPDAYVLLNELGRVVIGEAKSLRDLENSHTGAQVTAFLRRCGIAEGSALILAVPWPVERLARALLTNFRPQRDCLTLKPSCCPRLTGWVQQASQEG